LNPIYIEVHRRLREIVVTDLISDYSIFHLYPCFARRVKRSRCDLEAAMVNQLGPRHCERSDAIQNFPRRDSGFAALAMTMWMQ
jgi:hypothetical protein